MDYASNLIGKPFSVGGKYKSRHYGRRIGQESYGQGDGKNAEQRLRHPGVTPKGCICE